MKTRKIILRTFLGLAILAIGSVIAAVLLIKLSPSLRREILTRTISNIGVSKSMQIQVHDFNLALSHLRLDLDGIVVRTLGAQLGPPLARIERVSVEINVDSLVKRQWALRSLVIDHPVVHVLTDRNGKSNLPPSASEEGTSTASVFDLAIQKCHVNNGEIYFNDVKKDLAAELYNVDLRAQFDSGLGGYHGNLHYDRGQIKYANHFPVVHGLEAQFTATPAELRLDKLTIRSGRSQIVGHGELDNFDHPAINATFEAHLWTEDLKRILADPALPSGMIDLAGTLTYQNTSGGGAALQDVVLVGRASSSSLEANVQMHRIIVRDLSATYKLAQGNLRVEQMRGRVFGGNLNADFIIRDLLGAPHSRLQAQLHGISLEQLETEESTYTLPEQYVRGRISVQTEATWGRNLKDLAARGDLKLDGSLGENPAAPLSGVLHFDYSAARQEIELLQSYFRTPTTSVTMNGKVSRSSQLQITAHSTDLHQLELLVANFETIRSGKTPAKVNLYGAASFQGSLTGLLTEPLLQGRLDAENIRVKESAWKVLRANLEVDPSLVKLSDGFLEDAKKGVVKFNLRSELVNWIPTPTSQGNLEIALLRISLADLQTLGNQNFPISGMLTGNVSVHGSQTNPFGYGEIILNGGKLFSEPIQKLSLRFQGNGESVKASALLSLLAGSAHAQMTVNPKTRVYQAQVQAEDIRLEQLQTVKQRHLPVVGSFSFGAAGQGAISSPQLAATLKTSQLLVQDQTIRAITVAVKVHDRIAEATLQSEFAQTPLSGHGTIRIDAPYMAEVYLDTPRFSLQPLLALYAPSYNRLVQGETELHAALRGPLQHQRHLEGYVEISSLKASYQQLRIGAAKPIRIDYRNGLFTLQPVTLDGTGINLQLQGSIDVGDPASAAYSLKGAVDLSVVQVLKPGVQGSGQLQIDLDSRRHVSGSSTIGELRVVNAGIHGAQLPLGLDKGNGVATFSPTRVDIKNFQGQVGGSTVTARGGITFLPAIRFDLGISGKDIRFRFAQGIRAALDSDLTLVGNKQEAVLAGSVIIQRLSFTPDFDLSTLINQFGDEEDFVTAPGLPNRVHLNVELQSASQVNAVSTKISFRGSANLRLTGTAAEPVILGRADLTGGDLFLLGNRYTVESGAIDFINPLKTEPVVNAQVKTTVDQYDIRLNIQGTTDRLKTTYTSDPPLPPADIINLLAFGHTSQTPLGTSTSTSNFGAQSALVQGLGTAVSSRVEKFAGLSYFSIDPSLGGSNQNAGARVVIQERVTSNLVVTYSTDVTSTQRQAIQLEYRFSPRWSLSGVRDQNGGFGATANYHRTF